MPASEAIHPLFADLWPESRPRVEAGLAELARGIEQLERGELADAGRGAARRAAHRLVGTLGSYGLVVSAERVRELGAGFAELDAADPAAMRRLLAEVASAVRGAGS